MKVLSVTLLIVLSLMLSGCAEMSYKQARQQNTIAAYEEFLQQHPDSEYTRKARVRIESLKFRQAKKIGTVEAYEAYLKEYPKGRWTMLAKRRLEKAKANGNGHPASQKIHNVNQEAIAEN